MALRINTNLAALNSHRQLSSNDSMLNKSLEKLSSGLRINTAADDAAGLAISQKMLGQVQGLDQAQRNAQDAISMMQTAEGGLNETQNILQRMRELAVQGANDTLTTADRDSIQSELDQLSSEIDRIAAGTEFNTIKLLSGGTISSSGLTFQVGANAGQVVNLSLSTADATTLTVGAGALSVDTAANASITISNIDTALAAISTSRGKVGAYINRLQHTIANLGVQSENISAAKSRIMDLDMAKEVVHMSKAQILSQSATSMLAQANQSSQGVLSLLRGG
ncbi:MAG: flagellin [bacterium]|nr:flagellin [bacterium]